MLVSGLTCWAVVFARGPVSFILFSLDGKGNSPAGEMSVLKLLILTISLVVANLVFHIGLLLDLIN